MKIKFLYPRWGSEMIPWPVFLSRVKEEGFSGIEWNPDGMPVHDRDFVLQLLQRMQLDFSIVTTVAAPYRGFDDYLQQLKQLLLRLIGGGTTALKPLFVTVQTGREFFTTEQIFNCDQVICDIQAQTGVEIYQETHRNKWTFAAHRLPAIIEKRRNIAFTLDVSHWFCVSESYLADQQAAVSMAIEHTHHIHARIGYDQGAQVPDPALPEYEQALNEHLKVWDQWIEMRRQRGYMISTITPEFGPPPYMVTAGRTIIPEDEQWRLNLWMKDLLYHRYGQGAEKD